MPGEDRLALLTDRAHGFPAIVALQPASRVRKLVAQVSFQVVRETDPRDQPLRLGCGERRDFGDLLAVGNKGLIEAIGVDDFAYQPQRKGALAARIVGPMTAVREGEDKRVGTWLMATMGASIGGGTSEIIRNQIAERLLGLPRDPLIK